MDAETKRCFEELKTEAVETNNGVKLLHAKLFVGNGGPPITMEIDRLKIFRKISVWLFAPLYLGAITLLFRLIYLWLS